MLKGKSVSGELWLSPHTCTVENWLTSRCALEVPRCHTDPINWSLKKFTRTPQSRARMSKARTSCLSDGKCQTWSRLWSNDSKAILKHVVCQAGNLSFERLDISLFICQSTGQRSKCPCELCPPKSGIQRDRRGECRYSLAKFLNASSTFFHHLIGHEWPCLTAAKKKTFEMFQPSNPFALAFLHALQAGSQWPLDARQWNWHQYLHPKETWCEDMLCRFYMLLLPFHKATENGAFTNDLLFTVPWLLLDLIWYTSTSI